MSIRTHAIAAGSACLLLLAACGEEKSEDASGGGQAQVEVPVIEGDVARDDFCDLYAQIYCAANAGCCTQDALKSADEATCLAAAPCPEALADEVMDAMGAVYDPAAAGDFLRAHARGAAACRLANVEPTFLAGAGAEGDACTLGESTLQCGRGLACQPAPGADPNASPEGVCARAERSTAAPAADGVDCEEAADCASGRCAAGVCAARLGDGEPCASDDDCAGERCEGGACAPAGDAFCDAAPEGPPANTDWSDPDELCIQAHGGDDGHGTDADVTLAFLYPRNGVNYWWVCTIVESIDEDQERCCTAQEGTSTFRNPESDNGDVYVQMDDGDGLRFTSIKVKKGSSTLTRKTYRDSSSVSCKGCTLGYDCESCWVDNDGNGGCPVVRVPMAGNGVNYCYDELRSSDFF